MRKIGKLELTWVGKYDQHEIEPRILVEDKTKSFGDPESENMLIHGDNLIALQALQQDFAGKIKCIYCDPPYNINATGVPYDDNLEQSEWLCLLRNRLELLYSLLTPDGLLFIQIDDANIAYLSLLLDEIFGRKNKLNVISVKMSESSGVKMAHVDKRLPKLKEFILVYYKESVPKIQIEKVPIESWNPEYKQIIEGVSEKEIDELHELIHSDNPSDDSIKRCNEILTNAKIISLTQYLKEKKVKNSDADRWKFEHAKFIIQAVGSSSVFNIAKQTTLLPQDIMAVPSATGLIYLIKTDIDFSSKQPRVQIVFADDNLMQNPGDLWMDIKTTGGVGQEGGVLFANSKKPEKLIKRIITMCTCEGDIVLDSFLGSGTTSAVAHKLSRRWIGIEMGNHAYTLCKVRMDNVINGEQSGISKAVNWQGGGGYKFYELAPSLLVKNSKLPVYQINPEYTFEMLCEAICKLEGFRYKPQGLYHGHSSEKRFIHITKEFVNAEYIRSVAANLGEDQSLLIYGTKIQSGLRLPDNIEVKKIPKDLLKKCEFESEVR